MLRSMGKLGKGRGSVWLALLASGYLGCRGARLETKRAATHSAEVPSSNAAAGMGVALASGQTSTASDAGARATGAPPSYAVRVCSEPGAGGAAPNSAGSGCSSSGDPAFGLVLRGDILQKAQVLRGGELGVDANGAIACSDCRCPRDPRALVIDCPDAVISPGLINLHDHLSYANNAPTPSTERYDDRAEWRLGLRGHTQLSYAGSASRAQVSAHEFRMLLSGVTSIAGAAGEPGLVRNLDVLGLSEGLFVGHIDSDTFPLADSDGVGHASDCSYKKARRTKADITTQSAYLPHLAEGLDSLSQNELVCSVSGPNGLLGPTSAVVHAVGVSAPEARALASSGSWVVWSPRSNLSLYGNTAPVTLLEQSGVGLALGTDWLLSGSMNLGRELACARSLAATAFGGAFSDFDLFRMVTSNAARAAGVGRGLGALDAGYVADVAVFAKHGHEDYGAVVQAEPADVELVLRGGQALYGDTSLVSAFGAVDCEPMDVCGAPRLSCLLADAGLTLSALRAAGEAIYPLFSCGAPPNEPSCVPMRPGEYAPESSANDRDGDGIADPDDRCPDIFDPIRPLDRGAQADYDGDGIGDACDPCPLTPGPCPTVPLFDRDGDGVDDGRDDCPDQADPDQLDSDEDGQGDACDPCPAPNPGLSPCPTTVQALCAPSAAPIPPGSAVLLADVYVTALRPAGTSSQGFFVQDDLGTLGCALSVYSGSVTPWVQPGQRVTVRGYVSEYAGAPELSEPSVELAPK